MPRGRLTLPNLITIGRILACPAVFGLAIVAAPVQGILAFVLFLAAAFSDLWDGYLARKHGLVTDLGKLLDPLADKLLLLATFIPIFILSRAEGPLPWWGPLPVWVVVVIFGREVAITVFRTWAARRGVVIAAGKSGKYKALLQNFFIGGALLWFPLQFLGVERGWAGGFWRFWNHLHGAWIGVTLSLALLLTVYSLGDYLWGYRSLVRARD